MKFLLIFLSTLLLPVFCPEPVTVIEATSESWTGGFRGSGRGTNYRVTVVVGKSDRVLHFDSLWVGDRAFPVEASRPHPFTARDGFSGKDTVIIYASLFQGADEDGDLLPLPEPGPGAPVSLEGEGVLSYTYRNTTYYIAVKEFRELPSLDYP